MSEEKGITLISLSITVILLVILLSTTVYVGSDVVENMKVKAFVTQMQIIQAQVNIINQEMKNGNLEYQSYGKEIETLGDDIKEKANIAIEGKNSDGFKYFDSGDLEEININNMQQEVLINFQTREVISIIGVEKDKKMYYTQYDLPEGQRNVISEDINIDNPKFNIDKQIYGLSAKLTIKDIEYGKNIRKTETFIMQK